MSIGYQILMSIQTIVIIWLVVKLLETQQSLIHVLHILDHFEECLRLLSGMEDDN